MTLTPRDLPGNSASLATPGPWTLETVKTSCGICHKIGPFPWRDEKKNYACVYVDYPSHDGSAPRDKELLANACLIAAAPDLLEALKHVMGWIDAWNPNFTQDDEWPEYAHNIRAAIAKAEGR